MTISLRNESKLGSYYQDDGGIYWTIGRREGDIDARAVKRTEA
jgi:hypothetical protein